MAKFDTKKKANSVLTWVELHDGRLQCTVLGVSEPLVFNPARASAVLKAKAERHGWKQRFADGAALGRDPETGLSATPESKHARIKQRMLHAESGTEVWEIRAPAGPKADEPGLIVAGICRAFGIDTDEANRRIEATMAKRSLTRVEALNQIRGIAKVSAAILEIKAERAAAASTVDADALMADWDDEPADGDDEGDDEGEGDDEAPF